MPRSLAEAASSSAVGARRGEAVERELERAEVALRSARRRRIAAEESASEPDASSYAVARAHAEEAQAGELVHRLRIARSQAQEAPPPASQAESLQARAELARREDRAVRRALAAPPDYLETALGARPQAPAARGRWEQAAARIERYRFRRDVRDEHRALGQEPDGLRQRAAWREARRDLDRQRAELARDRSRAAARDIGRELG